MKTIVALIILPGLILIATGAFVASRGDVLRVAIPTILVGISAVCLGIFLTVVVSRLDRPGPKERDMSRYDGGLETLRNRRVMDGDVRDLRRYRR